jgi:transcriptional regulator with XRE-family HTH domain
MTKHQDDTTHENWTNYVERVSHGRDRADIARAADINVSGLSRWSSGQRPSAEKVVAFARGLGQSPVAALIAAGYLDPAEVEGATEVTRSIDKIPYTQLLASLDRRLAAATEGGIR